MLVRARWRQAVVGGSAGLLAAVAWRAADFPGALGGHTRVLIALTSLAGALIGLFAWTSVAAILTVAAAAVTAIVIATPVLSRPVHAWIRHDPLTSSGSPLDAVVVLSSSVNADGVLDAAGTERLVSGLEVLKGSHARLLITTRVATDESRRAITSDQDQRALIHLAGDSTAWLVAAPVHTTHDEAVRTAQLLAPATRRRIAVVTSPMHSRRACATFEAVGFHVVCTPSDERLFPVYSLGGPTARIRALSEYLYERLAVLEYRARGWMR